MELKKITTKEFIQKAKSVHGDRYDYSLVEYKNNHTKVKIRCPKHGIFEQSPKNHYRYECLRCTIEEKTNKRKLTTEEFIKRANQTHNDKYDYSSVDYINAKTKVKIICKKHGPFEQIPYSHLLGNGCSICARTKKLTTKEFIKRAKSVHGDRYDYSLVEYTNSSAKVKIICPEHGVFEQRADAHIRGQNCLFCSNRQTPHHTNKTFTERASEIHRNKYDYSLTKYQNVKTKIKIVCPEHGIFEQTAKNHLDGKGCQFCGGTHKVDIEQFLKRSNSKHNNKYDYSLVELDGGTSSKIKIVCPEHGIFEQNMWGHMNGNGCPYCTHISSKFELEIVNFIKTFYDKQVLQSDRTIISPLELDITIPDLKIAIECDGLYWHSEEAGKDRYYHINKTKKCEQNGYRLLHIMEDEWQYKREQVESKIKSILGYDDRERVFARKCKTVDINKIDKNLFLEKNHIQGKSNSSINYGLEYNNEIVAVMCFVQRSSGVFELVRYATSKHVIGGFSKLLTHFERNHNWSSIISFADRRWHTGETYEDCGFLFDRNTKPDYKYVVQGKRIHKFRFRHTTGLKKLQTYNPNLTEKENMQIAGIPRIYDCGLIRYIKIRKDK